MSNQCPYCRLHSDRSKHQRLWSAFYEEGTEAACALAAELGLPSGPEALVAHFDTHRVLQLYAPKLNRKEIDAYMDGLGERSARTLDLAFRVRGLGIGLLAAALFWSGAEGEGAFVASRKNAMLDVQDHFLNGFLFRLYLEYLPGKRSRTLSPTAYMLGPNARRLVDKRYGIRPRIGHDMLAKVEQAPAQDSIRRWQMAQLLPSGLLMQLPETLSHGRRSLAKGSERVIFDSADIYDGRAGRFRISDPLREHKQLQADGVFALRYADATRGALIPVFHYRDVGGIPADRFLKRVRAQLAFTRSPELRKVLPQLRGASAPLVLIAVHSTERLRELRERARGSQLAGGRLPALCVVEHHLEGNDPWDPIWTPLFTAHQRISLRDALASLADDFDDARNLIVGIRRPGLPGGEFARHTAPSAPGAP